MGDEKTARSVDGGAPGALADGDDAGDAATPESGAVAWGRDPQVHPSTSPDIKSQIGASRAMTGRQ
jgi:hypothetical protein